MNKETEAKLCEIFERDTNLNIHQRINAVMGEIDYIKKDKEIKTAKGAHMYNVTGHDAVTKLVHPLFVKYGINLIPSFCEMTSEMVLVKQYEKIQELHRTRVDASFKWINIDEPKDFFEQSWSGYGCDNADKGPGKAISYAQRMLVLKTLHIETGEKDLEEDEPEVIPHSEAVKERIAQDDIPFGTAGKLIAKGAQVALQKLLDKHGWSEEGIKGLLDTFMIDQLSELKIKDYRKMRSMIESQ